MKEIATAAAFLPIVTLLVVSLFRGVRAGIFTGFFVTAILFFWFGNSIVSFLAVTLSALVGTINIMMIIFGAVFLYHVMEQKGFIREIGESLQRIHSERTFRFYFLAFFLTAFFESVAGFGTPGAIVPLLLISLGYDAVVSIAVVLLIDGLFAMSGAIGTPVAAGLLGPLKLSEDEVTQIYQVAALSLALSSLFIMIFIQRIMRRGQQAEYSRMGWVLLIIIMVSFVLLSGFAHELTGLLASLILAFVAFAFLFQNRNLVWGPWIPYWLLIGLLLLPKLFPAFSELLAFEIIFNEIFGTDVAASLQPFRSPLIPFLGAAMYALYRAKDFTIDLKPVVNRTVAVFVILFPSLIITQLMLTADGDASTMVELTAAVFVGAGDAYPLVSPLLGIVGAFISGSTTVSNLIFGSTQLAAAESLQLSSPVILALQLAGASLGNAVCLFNIIAAAAVAGVADYKQILRLNLIPVIIASVIVSVVGYVLL